MVMTDEHEHNIGEPWFSQPERIYDSILADAQVIQTDIDYDRRLPEPTLGLDNGIPLQTVCDGTIYYYNRLPFLPKTLFLQNFSSQNYTVTFDTLDQITVEAGVQKLIVLPPASRTLAMQSVAAGTGFLLVVMWPFVIEPRPLNPNTGTGGGGGGGGAVTVANGADVAEGATSAAAYTDTSGSAAGTVIGIIKGLYVKLASTLSVAIASALPAGSNNIGGVEIIDAGGTNKVAVDASGRVAIQDLPGNQNVVVAAALPAGTNTVGNVNLNAGSNNIGGIEVIDSAGTNKLAVDASGRAAIQNLPGNQNVAVAAALPAGTNSIGTVGLNAGTNNVGGVEIIDSAGTNKLAVNGSGQANVLTELNKTPTNSYANTAEKGSNNIATTQGTSTATATTIVAARPTRKYCTIRNLDTANSFWVGPATVTTANGVILKAGDSRDFPTLSLLQIIDNGSHAAFDVVDYYD